MKKNVNRALVAKKKFSKISLTLLAGLLLTFAFPSQVWAGSVAYMRATTSNAAQGLVYITHNENTLSAPAAPSSVSNYADVMDANYTPSGADGTENTSGYRNPGHFYVWAQPSRGSLFSQWTASAYTNDNTPFSKATAHGSPSHLCPSQCSYCSNYKNGADGKPTSTGSADHYMVTPGRQQSADGKLTASWKADASATVTYMQTIGGEYVVTYTYLKVENNKFVSRSTPYTVSATSGNIQPEDVDFNGDVDHKSYKNDVIALTCSASNFIRWEEEDASTKVRTNLTHNTSGGTKSCTYTVTGNKNVNIYAIFKSADLGEIGGDKQINVDNVSTVYNYALTVPVTNIVGEGWSANDFVVNFTNKQGPATITQGEVSYSNGLLTIPFTYLANENGGTTVDVSVGTSYGGHVEATISAYAEEIVAWEAQIDFSGVEDPTEENRGTLAAMLARANSLSGEFTLTLRNDVEISEPLSFSNSFTFDINGSTITSTGAAALSIDKAGIQVVVEDGSFTKTGKIIVSGTNDGILSAVRFTERGQLTLNGGQLSVENNSANANAKAYTIYVSNEGVFSMTAGSYGKVVAKASTNAAGVYVATANDYATLNGGVIEVSANSNAYGIWSAGKTNITGATIRVKTLTGANAYGVYVNGVASTFENTEISVSAYTQDAYGAFVNAGQLNYNGGSISSTAPTYAYGVQVAASASATIQQQTSISATTGTGADAIGVNNLGTIRLFNTTIKASANTRGAVAIISNTATTMTIEDGLYEATANTGDAYGLHHQAGDLHVNGGLFKGIILSSGENAFGVRAIASATIKDATMLAEARNNAQKAYGFQSDMADVTIVLTNCSITGQSAKANAYGIHSKAKLTATNCNLFATTQSGNNAMGFYAENGDNQLVNTNATVSSSETQAWGVNHKAGLCSIQGGAFDVKAVQFSATAAANSLVYGIQNAKSMTTSIMNASFTVRATNTSFSQNAYGVYASGTVNTSNTHYDVMSRVGVYGVYGDGSSTLMLKDNTISSVATISANVDANAYGLYSNKTFSVDGDKIAATASAKTVYTFNFGSSAVGKVLSGKFIATGTSGFGPLNRGGSIGKVVLQGGYYNTATNLQYYTGTEYNIFHVDQSQSEYNEGYRYVIAQQNPSLYVCYIGNHGFETLEAAMQYAMDNSGTQNILLTQPYTLPEGNYTLPSNATLLIPYSPSQTGGVSNTPTKQYTSEELEENIRLVVASGVNWNIDGKIEVSAKLYCTDGATSYVQGLYGCMEVKEGSLLQLNSGARLYAWGYVIGKGEIKAKSGSEIREMFRVQDMKAIGTLYNNVSTYETLHQFPISQYYIQNIEAPVTFYYNSALIGSFYKGYKSEPYGEDNVKLVGTPTNSSDNYLFQIKDDDESTWVRKQYDAIKDRQVWTIGSKAEVGSMQINIPILGMSVTLDSKDYILPITNNMTVNIQEGGSLAMTQSVLLTPGSEINISKTASLVINAQDSRHSPIGLYVFDKDQWPGSISAIGYSPSWNKGSKPSRSTIDAAINVSGGEIIVKGNFYTTDVDRYVRDREGNIIGPKETTSGSYGANIYSNDDNAGTIVFLEAAPTNGTIQYLSSRVYNLYNQDGTPKMQNGKQMTETRDSIIVKDLTPAQLKNGDGTYVPTSGTTANQSWGYMNSAWVRSYTNGCFEIIDNKVYAKPSEYVELKNTTTGAGGLEGVANADHTYTTIEDKLLICQNDCQWWEVEATATDGVFECKKEGYEGFYSYNETAGEWQLVKRNVTFYLNEEKTSSKVVSVNYMGVPDQSVIATNPTKAQTAEYTYTFYGWKSSVTNNEYAWTATLEHAENDMYYTPVFTATKRKYTITLKNANNGADVPVETAYGEKPSYTPVKEPTAQYTYTFTGWTPELVTVTGPATYTANWDAVVNLYTITWQDGEAVLEQDKNQAYGNATAFNGTLPTKAADNEFEYAFDGWVSSVNGTKYNNGNTPTVSGDVTYTAHYATTPRYMITFVNYDGEELQKSAVTQGTAPVFNGTPRRDPDRDGYFRFIGWKNSNGEFFTASVALHSATKKETYTAQFEYITTVYTITFNNFDGNNGTWSNRFGEGETPSYDGLTPLGKAATMDKEYTLDYWVATSNSEHYTDPLPAVTKSETYTAVWAESARKYTITWVSEGNTLKQEQVAYGTIPTYTGATPTKAATDTKEYTFNNTWSPAVVAVNGDATYTAQFNESARTYEITWMDGNSNIIYTERVAADATPAYDETTHGVPTKTSTTIYDYSFNNTWNPAIAPVTDDAVYRAQFNAIEKTYTITFKDEDGTELKTQSLHYGDQPSCDQPTRVNTDLVVYTFNGWKLNDTGTASKTIPTVTADATYWANFTVQNNVALVNGTGYGTWAEAWTAANATANSTLKLLADINGITSAQTFTKDLTIDLNGHAINGAVSGNLFTATTNVTMTIDDSQTGGVIKNETSYNGALSVVYLNRGGSSYSRTYAKLIINGGTLIAKNTATSGNSRAAYTVYLYSNASSKVTVNGGTLQASNSRTAYNIYKQNGTATITGGKFLAQNGSTCNTFSGAVSNVEGGYFSHGDKVTAKTGKTKIELTAAHPEYAEGYRYVVEVAHTITWKVGLGEIATTSKCTKGQVAKGTPITAPTDGDITNLPSGCTFEWWDPEVTDVMPDQDLTYNAIFNMTAVKATEPQSISITSSTTLNDFTIQADATTSGEVLGAENLTVTGDAYFDYTFNAKAYTKEGQQWYAFGVPFQVNAVEGISYKGEHMVLGRDLDIVYYDGDIRATQGPVKTAWQYVEDQTEQILKPGVLYLAAFAADNDQPVRFKKQQDAPLNNTTVEVKAHQVQSGDAGWNGIANPTLFHATIGVEVRAGQTYVSGENRFSGPVDLTTETFVVGSPVMVQVANYQSVVVEEPSDAAPLRKAAKAQNVHYEVSISANEGKVTDHIWILADEDAKDEYTIGQDLAKAGVGTKVAQMWVNRYGHQLCMNTTAIENDMAEYPLAIFAPKAGEYTIALNEVPNNATIYLTENGSAIWNLNIAPAPISLSKGTENSYGLRLVRKINNVVTGFDEAVLNGNVQKVILNDHLYIIRDGKVYSAHGHVIK